jgi:hypothetical protein
MVNCQEDNLGFGEDSPTALTVTVVENQLLFLMEMAQESKIYQYAQNAISYKYIFSDGPSNSTSGI